jgi:hypothetical protein
MLPGVLLLALVALTVLAAALDVLVHSRRSRALRSLATQWQMNYHRSDQLRITPKVMATLPICGAANVRVMDLIYGSEPGRYRYVFSVEYTVGVTGPKRRVLRVANLIEPRRQGGTPIDQPVLTLAPRERGAGLLDQYRSFAPFASNPA